MLGLTLEGGGAKGAFHLGAVKALTEEGYAFDGITGTSIGALNGALLAQGDFHKAYELWESMDNSLIFDIEDTYMQKFRDKKVDLQTLSYFSIKLKDILEQKGLDTSRIRELLKRVVDEEKLRSSPIDFGLVTVSISDLKPLELYKEDIPEGKMVDYLMASANFPAFKIEPLDGKYYVDGGFYDNCPVNLLIRKGYDKIFAVRTLGMGIKQKVENPDVDLVYIIPSEDLGAILNFDNQLIQANLKMGYYDTLRTLKGLWGKRYYLTPGEDEAVLTFLLSLPDEAIISLGRLLSVPPMEPKRMLFEKILPFLADLLRLPPTAGYGHILTGLLEILADEMEMDRFRILTLGSMLEELMGQMEEKQIPPPPRTLAPTPIKRLASAFIKNNVLKDAARELTLHMKPSQFLITR